MRPTITIQVLCTACLCASPIAGQGVPGYPSARSGGAYMHNYYFPPAPSSTPWAPAWHPDGRELAFSMAGSIWSVDIETGAARELTYNAKYHSSPAWSPDGRWLAYTADNDGETIQLEVLEAATAEMHRLTDDEFVYTDPVFSPDGTMLAYVSTKGNGFFNVYIRPIRNGRWAGEEIAVTRDNDFGRNRLYFGPMDMHITPAWLPNGRELLLVSNRDMTLGSGRVLRVPAVADGITQSRVVLDEQTLYRTRPDVSLDGKRFVYSSTSGTADQFNNLYVQPTAGGVPYKLTYFTHDAFHPRWSPDGEWIAYVSNERGLPGLALLETYGGARRDLPIGDRRWKRPVGRLSVRVVHDEGGVPTAARITLIASDGKAYAPADGYARIGASTDHFFHTDGTFEVTLPVGTTQITAVKGFEVEPVTASVTIDADRTASVEIRLRRVDDMAADGWFSGSTHVHMNYGGNLHNTLDNLMFMSDAEDQDVVNELIANKDNRVLDYQFFLSGGGPHPVSTRDRIMIVGQEYRPPFYGHVFMIGLRDHIISPVVTGYEGTGIESLYPSNTDMLRKARAQGAVVGYVHAFQGSGDPLHQGLGGAKGLMMDAALATVDVVEWSNASAGGFHPVYALWNNGIRIAASGGEDSISDLHRSKVVGSVRTYVYTGNSVPIMEEWLEGLRAGRSFVTTGPRLRFRVADERPGGEVEMPAPASVRVSVDVRSITPLDRVWLVFNGETVEEIPIGSDRRHITVDATIPIPHSGWIQLRAEGSRGVGRGERSPVDAAYAMAFTNPVWITVDGQPIRDAASARYALAWLDTFKAMAAEWPDWRSDAETSHVMDQIEAARAVYRRLESEARR